MPDIMGEPDEDPTKTVYLVRHGETALNAQHLMRGWDDPVLNEAGRQDAQDAAKALKTVQIDDVFCSDLRRAQETMQTIVKAQQKPPRVEVTELLRTVDVGAWTGKPVDEVEPKLAVLQKRWQTDPSAPAPAGESWSEFQGRQLRAWKLILAAKGARIMVVSHLRCSVWALGFALVGGVALKGEDLLLLDRVTQATARISTLTYSKKDGLKILGVNAQQPET